MGKLKTFVGVDPGTTAAVAVLDLDGNLVAYHSAKNFGKADMLSFIIGHGKPLVVATDVAPAPGRVEEIAANTGSRLYVPDEDLQTGYKDELMQGFGLTADTHTRDALAAAEYARREYAEKLETIKERTAAASVEDEFPAVVEQVLLEGAPVNQAITAVNQPVEEDVEDEPVQQPSTDWAAVAEKRGARIRLLEEKVARLEQYVDELKADETEPETGIPEEELRERNQVINELRAESARQAAQIERLQEENETLQEAVDRLQQGWRYVPLLEQPAETDRDIVYVETFTGQDVARTVDTVLTEQARSRGGGVAVLELDEVADAVRLPGGVIVDPNRLEHQFTETEQFLEWLDEYRNR